MDTAGLEAFDGKSNDKVRQMRWTKTEPENQATIKRMKEDTLLYFPDIDYTDVDDVVDAAIGLGIELLPIVIAPTNRKRAKGILHIETSNEINSNFSKADEPTRKRQVWSAEPDFLDSTQERIAHDQKYPEFPPLLTSKDGLATMPKGGSGKGQANDIHTNNVSIIIKQSQSAPIEIHDDSISSGNPSDTNLKEKPFSHRGTDEGLVVSAKRVTSIAKTSGNARDPKPESAAEVEFVGEGRNSKRTITDLTGARPPNTESEGKTAAGKLATTQHISVVDHSNQEKPGRKSRQAEEAQGESTISKANTISQSRSQKTETGSGHIKGFEISTKNGILKASKSNENATAVPSAHLKGGIRERTTQTPPHGTPEHTVWNTQVTSLPSEDLSDVARDGNYYNYRHRDDDPMPKPHSGGVRPVNKLHQNESGNQSAFGRARGNHSSDYDTGPKLNGQGTGQDRRSSTEHNLRERRQNGTRHKGDCISPLESSSYDHEVSNKSSHPATILSTSRSGRSQTVDSPKNDGSGKPLEFKTTESRARPTEPRSRKRKKSSSESVPVSIGEARTRCQSLAENEDPTDPISESEVSMSINVGRQRDSLQQQSQSEFDIVIPPIPSNKYQGTANLQPARAHQGALKTGTSSRHFADIQNTQKSTRLGNFRPAHEQPRKPSVSRATRKQNDDSEGSIDELSLGQHGGMKDLTRVKALSSNKIKAQPAKLSKRLQSNKLRAKEDLVEVDDSESEADEKEEQRARKNQHIKPTQFESPASKSSKSSPIIEYYVKSAVGQRKKWSAKSEKHWLNLRHDSKLGTLELWEQNGLEPIWSVPTKKINKIEHSKTSAQLFLFFPIGQELGGDYVVHLEFGSPEQGNHLRAALKGYCSGLQFLDRDDYHMQAVLKTAEKRVSQSKGSRSVEAEDIKLMKLNQEKRNAAAQDLKLKARKSEETSDLNQNGSQPPRKRPRLSSSMKTQTDKEFVNLASDDEGVGRNVEPIPTENFYRRTSDAADPSTRPTRSSARVLRRPPSPSPPAQIKLWTELHPQWVDEFNWKGSISYPPDSRNKATVDQQDIERLDETVYLNDNLINFKLLHLQRQYEELNPDFTKRVYFMNTYFYERLSGVGGKGFNYKSVERWTSKVDIFSYDYIVVPISKDLHWFVAIICNAPQLIPSNKKGDESEPQQVDLIEHDKSGMGSSKASPSAINSKVETLSLNESEGFEANKVIVGEKDSKKASTSHNLTSMDVSNKHEAGEEDTGPANITSDLIPGPSNSIIPKKPKQRTQSGFRGYDPLQPRIVTMDSLALAHSPVCGNLKKYLECELKSKRGIDITISNPFGLKAKGLPEQSNYYDCGIFILQYVEMFLKQGEPFIHSILQNRPNVDLKWPNPSDSRNELRDLLFQIQSDQVEAAKKVKATKIKNKQAARPEPSEKLNHMSEIIKDVANPLGKSNVIPQSTTNQTSNAPKPDIVNSDTHMGRQVQVQPEGPGLVKRAFNKIFSFGQGEGIQSSQTTSAIANHDIVEIEDSTQNDDMSQVTEVQHHATALQKSPGSLARSTTGKTATKAPNQPIVISDSPPTRRHQPSNYGHVQQDTQRLQTPTPEMEWSGIPDSDDRPRGPNSDVQLRTQSHIDNQARDGSPNGIATEDEMDLVNTDQVPPENNVSDSDHDTMLLDEAPNEPNLLSSPSPEPHPQVEARVRDSRSEPPSSRVSAPLKTEKRLPSESPPKKKRKKSIDYRQVDSGSRDIPSSRVSGHTKPEKRSSPRSGNQKRETEAKHDEETESQIYKRRSVSPSLRVPPSLKVKQRLQSEPPSKKRKTEDSHHRTTKRPQSYTLDISDAAIIGNHSNHIKISE